MNMEQRKIVTDSFFKKCQEVLDNKGKDYQREGEAFGDMKEISNEIGVEVEKVLWVFLRKHYTAIKNYVRTGQLESEPIELRLVDLVNYCALMHCLLIEKEIHANLPSDHVEVK